MKYSATLSLFCISLVLASPMVNAQNQIADKGASLITRDSNGTADSGKIQSSHLNSDRLEKLMVAEFHLRKNRPELALPIYKALLKTLPDDQVVFRTLQIARHLNDTKTVQEAAERWAIVSPENPRALEIASIYAADAHAFERSLGYMKALHALGKKAHFDYLAERLAQSGSQEERSKALSALDQLIKSSHTTDANLLFASALLSESLQQPSAARDRLERVIAQNQRHIRAYLLLAHIEKMSGNHQKADGVIKRAYAKNPTNRSLSIAYVQVLLREGQKLDALNILLNVTRQSPKEFGLIQTTAILAFETENLAIAEQLFSYLLANYFDPDTSKLFLVKIHLEQNNAIEAEDIAHNIRLKAQYLSAWKAIGTHILTNESPSELKSKFDRARKHKPEHQIALHKMEADLLVHYGLSKATLKTKEHIQSSAAQSSLSLNTGAQATSAQNIGNSPQ